MYHVILHPKAIAEFDDAYEWYGKESKELGKRFSEAVLSELNTIQNNPEIFQTKRGDFREAILEEFPYVIVYILNKKTNTIKISAIYHTSRHPRKKYRR